MTAPATKTPPSPTPQSPRPWRTEKHRRNAHLLDADGDFIGNILDLDDGAFAVLAVNEHEARVEATELLKEFTDAHSDNSAGVCDYGGNGSECALCRQARAILSRIEGARRG